jgi:thioredoxin reductase (NADPH)
MATEPPRLTVYSRAYCHLCDELIAGLHALQARFSFSVEIVDVDAAPELEARFGEDVPVLMHGDKELCRHVLTPALVTDYLAEIG